MKMIQIVGGALGIAISTASMAVGYASSNNPLSGDIPNNATAGTVATVTGSNPVEDHWIQSYTPISDCGPACSAALLGRSELIIHMELENQSGCMTAGVACADPGVATTDTYNGNAGGGASTQGGAASGTVPAVPKLSLFTPQKIGDAVNGAPHYINLGQDDINAFSLTDWNFQTNAAGKVTTGHIIGFINLGPGAQIIGTFNFDTGTLTTYYGPEPLTAAEHTCLINSPHDPDTDGNPATDDNCEDDLVNGGVLSRNAAFSYINVGEEELEFGKAVPVPAFAAAALGLGLIGITILTGRRRQIK